MKTLRSLIVPLILLVALGAAIGTGAFLARWIETKSTRAVKDELAVSGIDWAQVRSDGLLVVLEGQAPSEIDRFNALEAAGRVVATGRIVDRLNVAPKTPPAPPRFEAELLRAGNRVSVIGLVPSAEERRTLLKRLRAVIGEDGLMTDLVEIAEAAPPEGWTPALETALAMVGTLPQAKISVTPGRVVVHGTAESATARQALEARLGQLARPGVALDLDIGAPRPVLSPYALRVSRHGDGKLHLDTCTATDDASRQRILAAARKAGLAGPFACTLALGAPTTRWPEAAAAAIEAIAALGGDRVSIVDVDVTLVAPAGHDEAAFTDVVDRLRKRLPPIFSLKAELPPPPRPQTLAEKARIPRFVVTRSPENIVQLRGLMRDALTARAATALAAARFPGSELHSNIEETPTLPEGWSERVIAGIEALGLLHHGALVIEGDRMRISGASGDKGAQEAITRLLLARLGSGARFDLAVNFDPALVPKPEKWDGARCVSTINAILAKKQITFDPGSAVIDRESLPVIDRIAEVMDKCSDVKMEVGGHTDSQGRESMNLALSQARAQAVIDALLAREVLTTNLVARGYGESRPIADNKTEEGRRRNRRIEFRLLEPVDTEDRAEEAERTGEAAEAEKASASAVQESADGASGAAAGETAAASAAISE